MNRSRTILVYKYSLPVGYQSLLCFVASGYLNVLVPFYNTSPITFVIMYNVEVMYEIFTRPASSRDFKKFPNIRQYNTKLYTLTVSHAHVYLNPSSP